jgi:cobalt transporter subunit CbtB
MVTGRVPGKAGRGWRRASQETCRGERFGPIPEEEIMQPDLPAHATGDARTLSRALADLIPALLGIALLGLVGFAPYPAVHDAFHDVRHTAGFPCH